jgi:hypothetical protein
MKNPNRSINAEYANFESALKKVLTVPHSEIKTSLEAKT